MGLAAMTAQDYFDLAVWHAAQSIELTGIGDMVQVQEHRERERQHFEKAAQLGQDGEWHGAVGV